MMVAILMWICFQVFLSQNVVGKVITINTNNGNESNACCADGNCPCSSLSSALQSMTSNTVINITSEYVTIDKIVKMGSGQRNLDDITISGNGATILCSNNASIVCDSCSNIIVKGITMDRCGDSGTRYTNAGLMLNSTTSISISNCTFQNSNAVALGVYYFCDNIVIDKCNFLSNQRQTENDFAEAGGLGTVTLCNNQSINVVISRSIFYNNSNALTGHGFGLKVEVGLGSVSKSWNVTISQTDFSQNFQVCSINIQNSDSSNVTLTEVLFTNNTASKFYSLSIYMSSKNVALSILSSGFYNHSIPISTDYSGLINIYLQSGTNGDAKFFFNNSIITDNKGAGRPIINIDCNSEYSLCLLSLNNVCINKNII